MLSVVFEVISHSKTITSVKVKGLLLTNPALPELQNLFKQIQNVPQVVAVCRSHSVDLLDEFKASLQGLSNIIEVREASEKKTMAGETKSVTSNSSLGAVPRSKYVSGLDNRQYKFNSTLGNWKEKEEGV